MAGEQTATDDAVASLRTQMSQVKAEAQTVVDEATTAVAASERKAAEAVAARVQADKLAIQNGLVAATTAADAAEARLAEASEKGDHVAVAKATREMNEAISTAKDYERRKTSLEIWEKNQATRTQQQQRQQPHTQQQPQGRQFSAATQAWLTKHGIDGQTDNAKFLKAQGAHFEALADGLAVDSPEYFAKLDGKFGGGTATSDSPLSQAATTVEVDLSKPATEQPQRREPPPVALAPSRPSPILSPPSNQITGGKVTLTANEVEAARISNPELWRKDQNAAIFEYAQNKAKLIQEGRL
jgi:hypothetical protein